MCLFGISFISCKEKGQSNVQGNRAQGPLTVDGFLVEEHAISDKVEVPGTLLPAEETQIRAEVSGRVVQLNIKEGTTVNKGALLVKLFDQDLQAQLKKLQVQLEIAKKTEERQRELLEINGISQQDYDISELQVENLNADIQSTKIAISKTEIRAPFNGKLGLKNISPGAYVTPASVVAVINQTNQLKLDFTVPEKYSAQMKPGQTVQFTYQDAGKKYSAKITATESGVSQNTRSLMVRSLIQGNHEELLPGSFAKVQLHFDPDPNAILVPTQAVLPQARGKKVIKYEAGFARFVDVTTGVRDSARIQITEGLKKGDTIVVTGLLSTRPDAAISINKIVE